MREYVAKYMMGRAGSSNVTIMAKNQNEATTLLEAQYGKGTISMVRMA